MSQSPIGVIDSGIGGLTILKSLLKALPYESFIYYGDTKNAPYGEKDLSTLKTLAKTMVHFMEEKQVKLLVVACNTITASGVLQEIKTTIPQICEIIEPTVKYAVAQKVSDNFTLLATDVTTKSGVYQSLLKEYAPKAIVNSYSLPELVKLAEQAKFTGAEAEHAIKNVVRNIKPNSTTILGCTHYPFFTSLFKKYLDPSVRLVDSSEAVCKQVKNITSPQNHGKQMIEYYVSGDKQLLNKIVTSYLDSSF